MSREEQWLDLERQVRERTAELRTSRDLLQATMDSSTDMIQVFEAIRDENGQVVDFRWVLNNHTSESLYGEIRGESLLERNPGVVEEGIFDAFRRVTETGIPEQAERRYQHEQFDGWFYQSVVKLNDGVATTTKEISVWKAAQAQVLRLREEVAESKLSASEGRLAAIFADAPVGLSEISLEGRFLRVNGELCRLLGRERDDLLALTILDVTHPDDLAKSLASVQSAIATGGAGMVDKRYCRPDGTEVWASSTVSLLRDPEGKPHSLLVATADLSARREAEEALRASTERQKILLAELQHRVRNILAVTRSIISRSHDGERSTEEYVQHLQGRISALARTQVLLTRTAGAGVDLENMIRDELLAQAAADAQFTLEGPDILLSPKAAEVLTLAVHELATNAIKYGAFSRTGAHLDLRWRVELREGQDWLLLDWTETGVPIVEATPRRLGFGSELISRRIPYELRGYGSFEIRPGGFASRIEFPLVPGESILQSGGDPR
ncbi:PAS domain S-box protein [Sphingomonas sp. PL-96]|uniref:sensor histidine kinase n=1 Tax=Sphingomonas sp. PL-96 TaxID=2887201 RepID=UPI001E5988ED|nr:PAS domain S-box protein [Sphingomonas sp. PL-96]MCC2977042.1 PAS domain S-box protein [Sphingomonas sp. PL-96]